ncbi:hypothetical protein DFH08DRAFT_827423 [Mycena albidolilacea]|uniref:Uncharacterized protein n=1 Tax=Mycena albidolilacea TaxID=1033008 RepID=A0AAD6YYT1_9AGAR|nr:hypothetical protein DFH08DRAFT_827423 [Mycena albidolilacea]
MAPWLCHFPVCLHSFSLPLCIFSVELLSSQLLLHFSLRPVSCSITVPVCTNDTSLLYLIILLIYPQADAVGRSRLRCQIFGQFTKPVTGNEPLISGLSNIDLNMFAASHPNYQVPDLKEYPPLVQYEASSTAIAIQKTNSFGAQTLRKVCTGPLGAGLEFRAQGLFGKFRHFAMEQTAATGKLASTNTSFLPLTMEPSNSFTSPSPSGPALSAADFSPSQNLLCTTSCCGRKMFADADQLLRYPRNGTVQQQQNPSQNHWPRGREPVPHLGQRGRGGARPQWYGWEHARWVGRSGEITAIRNSREILWARVLRFSTDSGDSQPCRVHLVRDACGALVFYPAFRLRTVPLAGIPPLLYAHTSVPAYYNILFFKHCRGLEILGNKESDEPSQGPTAQVTNFRPKHLK